MKAKVMPTLPKKLVQALEAVLYIATHTGVHPVSGKEICEFCGLSKRHFEPLLQRLVHQKILRGIRGPHGGYSLAKERRKLTLADLYEAVCIAEANEKVKKSEQFTPQKARVIKTLWKDIEHSIIERLQAITIADLCDQLKENEGSESSQPKDKDANFII